MYSIPTNQMTFAEKDLVIGYTFPVKVISTNDGGTVNSVLDIDNISTTQKILAHTFYDANIHK